jgi:hypothetical protein
MQVLVRAHKTKQPIILLRLACSPHVWDLIKEHNHSSCLCQLNFLVNTSYFTQPGLARLYD